MDLKPQQIEKINIILGSSTNDMTVMGEAVFKFLMKQPKVNRPIFLCYALQNKPYVLGSGQELKNPGLTELAWKNYLEGENSKILARQLNKILDTAHKSAKNLAGKLWEIIINQGSRQEKIFALSVILHSKLVPLVLPAECPGSVSLTDEKFSRLKEKLLPQITSIIEIKNANIPVVRKAAAIYHLLEAAKTKESQAILMGMLLLPLPPIPTETKHFPGDREISESIFDGLRDQASKKAILINQILNSEFFGQKTQTGGAIWHYLKQQENEDLSIILLAYVLITLSRNEMPSLTIVEVLMPGNLSNLLESLAETLQTAGGSENQSRVNFESHSPEDCLECNQVDCPKHPHHKEKIPGGFVCSHSGSA